MLDTRDFRGRSAEFGITRKYLSNRDAAILGLHFSGIRHLIPAEEAPPSTAWEPGAGLAGEPDGQPNLYGLDRVVRHWRPLEGNWTSEVPSPLRWNHGRRESTSTSSGVVPANRVTPDGHALHASPRMPPARR